MRPWSPVLKSVRRGLSRALDAGLHHHADPDTRQRARIFHATMLLLVLTTVAGTPLMAMVGYPPNGELLLYVCGYVIAYHLSVRGWFRAARAVGFAVLAFGIGYYGLLMGADSGLQNAALVLAGTPFVVVAPRERGLLAWAVGCLLISYVTVTHADLHELPGLLDSVSEGQLEFTVFSLAALVLGLLLSVTAFSERQKTDARDALRANNASMRVILDNTRDALLTVDPEGRILGTPSAILTRWFGPVEEEESLGAYLRGTFSAEGDLVSLVFESLRDGFMPEEVVLAQLPRHLRANGRSWELSLQPVRARSVITHFVVVIAEVTESLERARAERVQRAVVNLFVAFRADPHGVRAFLSEADALTALLVSGAADIIGVRRAVHTLKANTAAYRLHGLAEMCHELEEELEFAAPTPAVLEPFLSLWRETRAAVAPVLAERREGISEEDLLAVARDARWAAGDHSVQELIRVARLEPVRVRLEACRALASDVARRLGLPEPRVSIIDEGIRQDPGPWGPFWSSLSHVLRNAVVHGLEGEDEREALGKQAEGRVVLAARVVDGQYCLTISDDGRGVDWDGVADRARAAGLPTDTEDGLTAALFSDGITTRDGVDALSGRGVGLAAVLGATRALGGTISVRSLRGQGTSFRFSFPAESVVQVGAPYEPAGEPASNAPFESTGATKAG